MATQLFFSLSINGWGFQKNCVGQSRCSASNVAQRPGFLEDWAGVRGPLGADNRATSYWRMIRVVVTLVDLVDLGDRGDFGDLIGEAELILLEALVKTGEDPGLKLV